MSELSKLTIKVPIGLLEITATDEAIVGVKLLIMEKMWKPMI